jgi:hypothetical protein
MNFGNRGGQTIRLTITRGDKKQVVLTGTSYKDWVTQATEFLYRTYGSKTEGWRFRDIEDLDIEVERSLSKWVGWGGLKWCSEEIMQEELNREGVQQNEPDNPKPRQYSTFKFEPYDIGYRKLMKELRGW